MSMYSAYENTPALLAAAAAAMGWVDNPQSRKGQQQQQQQQQEPHAPQSLLTSSPPLATPSASRSPLVSYGAKASRGSRREMEDTFAIHADFVSLSSGSMDSPTHPSTDSFNSTTFDEAGSTASPSCANEGPFSHSNSGNSSGSHHHSHPYFNPFSGSDTVPQENLSFFGVYDGHGGIEVAEHCAKRLHQNFREALNQQATAAVAAAAAAPASTSSPLPRTRSQFHILRGDQKSQSLSQWSQWAESTGTSRSRSSQSLSMGTITRGSSSGASPSPSCSDAGWAPPGSRSKPASSGGATSDTSSAVASPLARRTAERVGLDASTLALCEALRQAFLKTDEELQGTEVGELVGSTAVVAVLGSKELYVAHCGDSRAVLCHKGRAVSLTLDHKPDRKDEAARIEALGGKVVPKCGGHRVMGLLAMSRAIGDHFLRSMGVIAEPEVMAVNRSSGDEILLLASDGLWDVFTNQEAASLALRCLARARTRGASFNASCRIAASVLTKAAIERGSRDNITVVLVDLRQPQPEANIESLVIGNRGPGSQAGDAPADAAGTRHGRSSSWTEGHLPNFDNLHIANSSKGDG